jgi:7,8-dihydropterin-6-yl-methyl-4-(beta-D-ribofuranosyl)aminobenzene 5'-phosphate synthase
MLTAMTFACCAAFGAGSSNSQAHALKITVLVTNLGGDPYEGDGEWGYSALVEVDGHKILYDTGLSADLVLRNAKALKVDLSDVEDVVLSHNHYDHDSSGLNISRPAARLSCMKNPPSCFPACG